MTNRKPTVAERAVRGVLGGWVAGTKYVANSYVSPDCTGDVLGLVYITVPVESVKKMLADERKAKKGKR